MLSVGGRIEPKGTSCSFIKGTEDHSKKIVKQARVGVSAKTYIQLENSVRDFKTRSEFRSFRKNDANKQESGAFQPFLFALFWAQ